MDPDLDSHPNGLTRVCLFALCSLLSSHGQFILKDHSLFIKNNTRTRYYPACIGLLDRHQVDFKCKLIRKTKIHRRDRRPLYPTTGTPKTQRNRSKDIPTPVPPRHRSLPQERSPPLPVSTSGMLNPNPSLLSEMAPRRLLSTIKSKTFYTTGVLEDSDPDEPTFIERSLGVTPLHSVVGVRNPGEPTEIE